MSQTAEASNSSAPQRLERTLGPWMAAAIVVGCVIGSGVFKKPHAVAEVLPDFTIAMSVWILVGGLAFFGGLAMAEVTVLLPKAGGNYVFLREAYGPMFGFLWGWVEFFIIRSASIAALAAIFAESLHDLVRQFQPDPQLPVFSYWTIQNLTITTIAVLALVNARGVRWGGGLQVVLTAIKIGSILAMALAPFVLYSLNSQVPAPDYSYLKHSPDVEWTLGKYGAAAIAVIWAYHGWMNLGPVAEEIRAPQRNVPLALLGGIGTLVFLYLSVNVAYAVVISQQDMAALKGTSVAAEFSSRLLGRTGAAFASAAVMCSVFGSLNGNLLVGPRLLYAMSEDGLAPRQLSAIHSAYKTPAIATLVYAGWSIAIVLLVAILVRGGKDNFDTMTDYAMFGAVCFETMAVASVFVFRFKRPNADRPYRCLGYPIVPAIYIMAFSAFIANYFISESLRLEAISGVGFVLVGAAVYAIFLRKKSPTS